MFAAYLSCLNLSSTPSSPAAVDKKDDHQPFTDSWSVNVDQVTPMAGSLEMATLAIAAANCKIPRAVRAATSTWCRSARCLTASNPGNANANNDRPLNTCNRAGLRRSEPGNQQSLQQLQCACKSPGRTAPGSTPFRPNYTWQKALALFRLRSTPSISQQLWRPADGSPASFQHRVLSRSRQPGPCESVCKRSREWLAVLGDHTG